MPNEQDAQQEQIKKIVEEVIQEKQQQEKTPTQKAIVDCANAYTLSLQAISYCLTQGGPLAQVDTIKKMQDCMELCSLTIKCVIRESDLLSDIAKLCSQACDSCVKLGEKFRNIG